MAADDLTKPLGLEPRRQSARAPVLLLIAPVLVIAIGAALVWAVRSGDPWGPKPAAVAAIDGAPEVSGERTGSVAPASPATAVAPVPTGLTEVKPEGGISDLSGGEVVIHDPSKPDPVRLAAAPMEGLVEKSGYGLLPRVGIDGTRPLEAYARPVDVPHGTYRIAIIVGGIGVDDQATAAAIAGLPGEVTLAFAPYGANIASELADARAAGHEILLQIPLEPYNYPEIDPGPKTLTTGASAAENIDRLHWLMSRISTYVGIVNYMGARFTGNAEAMAPVLSEIGSRGLLYLDDGSSALSHAGEAAKGKVPYLQADVVLDADTSAAAIDARLDQLVAIARERGFAIGTGSAFPSTIDRIVAFARKAEEKGIALVPVSSLAPTGRT